MIAMESVDLNDASGMAQSVNDNNNDKGPVSLDEIHIEASEERLRWNITIISNFHCVLTQAGD